MAKMCIYALLLVFVCVPAASACEQCAEHFDGAAQDWCWDCEWTYCGSFGCSIYDLGTNLSVCEENGGGCFEYEGVATHRCGPDYEGRFSAPASTRDGNWRLVKTRIEQRVVRVHRTRRG